MAEMRNDLYEFSDQSIKDRNQVLDQVQEAVIRMETFYSGSIQEQERLSQNQNFYSRDRNYPSGGFRPSNTPDRQYYTSGACADVMVRLLTQNHQGHTLHIR